MFVRKQYPSRRMNASSILKMSQRISAQPDLERHASLENLKRSNRERFNKVFVQLRAQKREQFILNQLGKGKSDPSLISLHERAKLPPVHARINSPIISSLLRRNSPMVSSQSPSVSSSSKKRKRTANNSNSSSSSNSNSSSSSSNSNSSNSSTEIISRTSLRGDSQTLTNSATSAGLKTTFGKFSLFDHQIQACEVMLRPSVPGLLLYYDMGSGKTLTCVAVAENLMRAQEIRGAVVVMPPVIHPQFQQTLRDAKVDSKRYKIVTPAGIRKLMPDSLAGTLLILDEAHVYRSEGENFKQALRVSLLARKRLLMTGTPLVNYPDDIAPLIELVVPGRSGALATHHAQKMKRAFQKRFTEEGTMFRWDSDVEPELKEYLKCTTLYYAPDRSMQSVRDAYPTSTERFVFVPMSERQSKLQLEIAQKDTAAQPGFAKFFNTIEFKQLESYYTRYRVIASVLKDRETKMVYAPKLDHAFRRIVACVQNGRKAIVYSGMVDKVLGHMKELLETTSIRFAIIAGEVSQAQIGSIQNRFNAHSLDVLLIGRKGQVGLDLKNTSEVHIMEPDFNENTIRQAIARAVRNGSHDGKNGIPRHVEIYRYVATLHNDYRVPSGHKLMQHMSADERLAMISKQKINMCNTFLNYMKRISRKTHSGCGVSPSQSSQSNGSSMRLARPSNSNYTSNDTSAPGPSKRQRRSRWSNVLGLTDDQKTNGPSLTAAYARLKEESKANQNRVKRLFNAYSTGMQYVANHAAKRRAQAARYQKNRGM